MHKRGFEEEQAGYAHQKHGDLVGQFRRLGPAGPAYEIIKVDDDGTVHVELVYNDERVTFPLTEVLDDPVAETIP